MSCDLFFPYSLEDAPAISETADPPEDDTDKPEGIFFSVAENKYVKFSSGNLQYNAFLDEWRFAPNQYDWIGEANRNISSTYNGWIDLFGWGTSDSPTKKSQDCTDYTIFIDWGNNKIGNNAKNTWRTLTEEEWDYVLEDRLKSTLLNALGCIDGVNGLILLPDNWERPAGVTFNSGIGDGLSQNVYTLEKWELMESAGAVFLPAAGNRSGIDIADGNEWGYYWSSSLHLNQSQKFFHFCIFSSESHMVLGFADINYCGHSVRLVKEISQ